MLSMSPGKPQAGVPVRKGAPGVLSRLQDAAMRGQPSPGPLLPSVGHRGEGTHCGGFAAELRPGHGDTPMGSGRDSCRQAIPHLVSALHGAGCKMLLTQKREE